MTHNFWKKNIFKHYFEKKVFLKQWFSWLKYQKYIHNNLTKLQDLS